MPFMWSPELQDLLPKPGKDILRKQQRNFQRDWAMVSNILPNHSQDQYLHFWMLVNTRSFYYTTPSMEKFPHDDRLALLPVADFFNHAETGCDSTFSSDCYTITANRDYTAGEEVPFCYGNHSNDFLLAEYGFVLAQNQWDEISLDDVIIPSLAQGQKDWLEEVGYLGEYKLYPGTKECPRTQLVLDVLTGPREQAERLVESGDGVAPYSSKATVLLQKYLATLRNVIQQKLEDIQNIAVGQESHAELLSERWKQMETIVVEKMHRFDR